MPATAISWACYESFKHFLIGVDNAAPDPGSGGGSGAGSGPSGGGPSLTSSNVDGVIKISDSSTTTIKPIINFASSTSSSHSLDGVNSHSSETRTTAKSGLPLSGLKLSQVPASCDNWFNRMLLLFRCFVRVCPSVGWMVRAMFFSKSSKFAVWSYQNPFGVRPPACGICCSCIRPCFILHALFVII